MDKKEKRIKEFIKNNNIPSYCGYNLNMSEEDIYRNLYKQINLNYDKLLKHYMDSILSHSFYNNAKTNYNKSFQKLLKVNNIGNTGLNIIDYFHPSIYMANKKNHLSPYNAWSNIDIMTKTIKNRFIYKGNNLSLSDIKYGLEASGLAPKVSIFKPSLAKYLINKYLHNYNEIFDPCSGYSGRLLGTCSLSKKYIGQDINPVTVSESQNLVDMLKLTNCEVNCVNSLNVDGKYECLFTCPPYGDKENWNQSIESLSCDEWIDECLTQYKCESYLFVVDNTVKYKNNVVEEINNSSHFNKNKELVIFIF